MADGRRPLLDLDEDSSYIPPPSHPISSTSSRPHHHQPSSHKHNPAYVESALRLPYAEAFDKMKSDKDNSICFDCGSNQTSWVSMHFGVFICLKCAGEHRGLGVHITVVRSINLDAWSPDRLLYMLIGGNARAKEFFSQDISLLTAATSHKYNSPIAAEYKKILRTEHDSTLRSLEERGIVQPTPTSHNSSSAPSSPSPANMSKYANATSISSDQYFEQKKKKSRSCCA